MSKTIKISDNIHLRFFCGENEVPMVKIAERIDEKERHVMLTCDEMNKLVKEYLAQQML